MSQMSCAVVGVGQIGGSLGLALREKGFKVIGVDVDSTVVKRALSLGAIDQGSTELADAAGAQVVFLCPPLDRIVQVARELLPKLPAGCIVTDVGSVKGRVVGAIEAFRPPSVHYIGGHPMMGTEGAGIDVAKAALTQGAPFLLTPTSKTPSTATAALSELLAKIGMKPMVLPADEHDRMMAQVSHVPYLLSVALMRSAQRTDGAGPTFRDMTRVAASPPGMWTEIITQNRAAIRAAAQVLVSELDRLASLDGPELNQALAEAKALKEALAKQAKA
jgi:prephenate dehydrogenase